MERIVISSPEPLEWLQTLADATRVRLLRLLNREELSVTELCTILQLPQSTVSRHLKVLVSEGWIENRRDGTAHLYRAAQGSWTEPRQELWGWVRNQSSQTPSSQLDDSRLQQVLAERPVSKEFLRSAADRWDALRVELFGSRLDAHVLAATLPSQAVVGELGCGSAPLAQLVAPLVHRVIAVDSSAAMLAAAERQLHGAGNVELLAASLEALPIPDGHLDAAWLVLVLPYVEEPLGVLREAARVLKPQAPLVVVDMLPHDRDVYRQQMGHVRLGLERGALEQWCSDSGLELERYIPLPPDSAARGPALFAAVAKRSHTSRDTQGASPTGRY
jgi:SAM-dependent methyltransferase